MSETLRRWWDNHCDDHQYQRSSMITMIISNQWLSWSSLRWRTAGRWTVRLETAITIRQTGNCSSCYQNDTIKWWSNWYNDDHDYFDDHNYHQYLWLINHYHLHFQAFSQPSASADPCSQPVLLKWEAASWFISWSASGTSADTLFSESWSAAEVRVKVKVKLESDPLWPPIRLQDFKCQWSAWLRSKDLINDLVCHIYRWFISKSITKSEIWSECEKNCQDKLQWAKTCWIVLKIDT